MSAGNLFPVPAELGLGADEIAGVTGKPEKTTFLMNSVSYPAWSFSGAEKESVAGTIATLPEEWEGIRVEIVVAVGGERKEAEGEAVFRVHLSQDRRESAEKAEEESHGMPVRTLMKSAAKEVCTIVLESYYGIRSGLPLRLRIERCADDPADTCSAPVNLLQVKVSPVKVEGKPEVVQDTPGYNSWPMIQAIGNTLVCAYTRGRGHDIGEGCRGVYARTSSDGGKSWTPETLISNQPDYGEVTIGKGLDSKGAMLLWVRCCGPVWHHDLYRSADGVTFTRVATPKLDPMPMQITDIFHVPEIGLMALWFAGNYRDDELNSWGTLISRDNGTTWKQEVIEAKLPKAEWPTEPSAVYLGNGRILVIARTECPEESTVRAQFQLESMDFGKTWTRSRTNIGDVNLSTPSLILDPETGFLSNYYYHRGTGVLKRRVTTPERIWGNPLAWPDPEPVALASAVFLDAGNVNVTAVHSTHFAAYYSGKAPDTAVVVSAIPAPKALK